MLVLPHHDPMEEIRTFIIRTHASMMHMCSMYRWCTGKCLPFCLGVRVQGILGGSPVILRSKTPKLQTEWVSRKKNTQQHIICIWSSNLCLFYINLERPWNHSWKWELVKNPICLNSYSGWFLVNISCIIGAIDPYDCCIADFLGSQQSIFFRQQQIYCMFVMTSNPKICSPPLTEISSLLACNEL